VERILNQEEIDELLAAFDEGEIDARLAEEPSEGPAGGAAEAGRAKKPRVSAADKQVSSIDLTRGQNYSKWRIANLDIVFNSFARYYAIALTNSLQQGVTIQKGDIESRFFEDFLAGLQNPGVLGGFTMDPLKGSGLFVFDKTLCFGLIEVLFGMSASSEFVIPQREVTAIEANILRSLLSEACQVFNRAFATFEQLNTSITRVETNPKLLTILAPDTEVIQVSFTAQLGSLEGEIMMLIPYFSLEPFKEKLRDEGLRWDEGANENKWVRQLETELSRMEIPVSAIWGDLSLTIQELLGLEAGDIVSFDYDEEFPIQVLAGSQPKFRAEPGVRNGKKVVRIKDQITTGE